MLKKAGAAAFAAAGLMMLGSPAFAAPSTDVDFGGDAARQFDGFFDGEAEQHDQMGLLNFGNDADVLSNLSLLCNDDVNVIAVPILQGNDGSQLCGNTDDDDNDGASSVGDSDD